MRSSHQYSILHLHSDGAAAITHKSNANGALKPQFFYQSPKATGSLDTALKRFFAESKKDLLYINLVSEAPTLKSFPDTNLLKEPDAFAQVLEANSGIMEKDCDVQFLESSHGTPFKGRSPLLVNSFKRSDYLRAQALASELEFEDFELFNNTLSMLGALSDWRKEFKSLETVAILEVGNAASTLTLTTSEGKIASKKIPVSVMDLASGIQKKLQLKFESAAMLLFYNGIFDFGQHKDAISASFAEELNPHLKNICSKYSVEIDRLLISCLPPSYNWLAKEVPKALGLQGFSADEFYFLKDLSSLSDCGSNPGFIGLAFCAHTPLGSHDWMIPLSMQSIAQACNKSQGFTVSLSESVKEQPIEAIEDFEETTFENEDYPPAEDEDYSSDMDEAAGGSTNGIYEDSMVEEIILEDTRSKDPIEVITFSETPKEDKTADRASKEVKPINEEEPEKSKLGLIFGGLAALLIIGGGYFFYLQNAPKPLPIPKQIVKADEVVADKIAQIEKPVVDKKAETEVAKSPVKEPERTLTRPGRDPGRELEKVDLIEPLEPEVAEITPPTPVPLGHLLIDSTPSGASIYVNSELKGRTPVTVDELQFGEFAVEFKLDGYVTKLLDVSVESEEVQMVSTQLDLPVGVLEVHTTPEGVAFDVVSVQGLDKIIFSGVTPTTIPDVLKGQYDVQFNRDNWEDYSESVIVRYNDISRIDLVYPEGWLMITSTPDNASVFEKGIFIGKTPLRLKGLKEGEKTYTLRQPGYEDAELATEIEAQTEKRIEGTLLSWDREVNYNQLDVTPTQLKRSLSNTQRLVGDDSHRFVVEFVINKDGIPENIEVLETTYLRAHERLLKDISNWTFEPGMRKDHAVKTRVRLPIILGDASKMPPAVELARTSRDDE